MLENSGECSSPKEPSKHLNHQLSFRENGTCVFKMCSMLDEPQQIYSVRREKLCDLKRVGWSGEDLVPPLGGFMKTTAAACCQFNVSCQTLFGEDAVNIFSDKVTFQEENPPERSVKTPPSAVKAALSRSKGPNGLLSCFPSLLGWWSFSGGRKKYKCFRRHLKGQENTCPWTLPSRQEPQTSISAACHGPVSLSRGFKVAWWWLKRTISKSFFFFLKIHWF